MNRILLLSFFTLAACSRSELEVVSALPEANYSRTQLSWQLPEVDRSYWKSGETGWDVFNFLNGDALRTNVNGKIISTGDISGSWMDENSGLALVRFSDSVFYRVYVDEQDKSKAYLDKLNGSFDLLSRTEVYQGNFEVRPAGIGIQNQSSLFFGVHDLALGTRFFEFDLVFNQQFSRLQLPGKAYMFDFAYLKDGTSCLLVNENVNGSRGAACYTINPQGQVGRGQVFNRQVDVSSTPYETIKYNSDYTIIIGDDDKLYSSNFSEGGLATSLQKTTRPLDKFYNILAISRSEKTGRLGIVYQNRSIGGTNIIADMVIAEVSVYGKLESYELLTNTKELRGQVSLSYTDMKSWRMLVGERLFSSTSTIPVYLLNSN